MTLFIASDHAGFELKQKLKTSFDLEDLGPDSDESVDYPDYAKALCEKVLATNSKGILLCGSGIGMSITANRFQGIRAALVNSEELAALSRQHNDANVLILAARFIYEDQAQKIVNTWLNTDFEGGRHQRRVEKIEKC